MYYMLLIRTYLFIPNTKVYTWLFSESMCVINNSDILKFTAQEMLHTKNMPMKGEYLRALLRQALYPSMQYDVVGISWITPNSSRD